MSAQMDVTNRLSQGVLAGLELQLEHPPPFSSSECETMKHLQVLRDAAPAGLDLMPALTSITYRGCEEVEVRQLATRRLSNFYSWSSNLTDISLLPMIAPELTTVAVEARMPSELPRISPEVVSVRLPARSTAGPALATMEPELPIVAVVP